MGCFQKVVFEVCLHPFLPPPSNLNLVSVFAPLYLFLPHGMLLLTKFTLLLRYESETTALKPQFTEGCSFFLCLQFGEHSGDHNHQDFPKSTAIQMGGVLRYKWEAYCVTNRRSTDSISLSSERRGTESAAIQIGGVLQYKLEVYCDTFLRSSGGWGF